MNWRMMGLGLAMGSLPTLLLFLGPGVTTGAIVFLGLPSGIACVAILFAVAPRSQSSSKIRGLFEWIMIGIVWTTTSLLVFVILNLR